MAIMLRCSTSSEPTSSPSEVTVNRVPLTRLSVTPGSCTVASTTAPSGRTTLKPPEPLVLATVLKSPQWNSTWM